MVACLPVHLVHCSSPTPPFPVHHVNCPSFLCIPLHCPPFLCTRARTVFSRSPLWWRVSEKGIDHFQSLPLSALDAALGQTAGRGEIALRGKRGIGVCGGTERRVRGREEGGGRGQEDTDTHGRTGNESKSQTLTPKETERRRETPRHTVPLQAAFPRPRPCPSAHKISNPCL